MDKVDLSNASLFASEAPECKAELAQIRWVNGYQCPRCLNNKAYWLKKRDVFECSNKSCKKQTSATSGTQFHRTRSIDKLWGVMKTHGRTAPELSKKFIKNAMNVVAETARRAWRIFWNSFGQAQVPSESVEETEAPTPQPTPEATLRQDEKAESTGDSEAQECQLNPAENCQRQPWVKRFVYLLRFKQRKVHLNTKARTPRQSTVRKPGAKKQSDIRKRNSASIGLYWVEVLDSKPSSSTRGSPNTTWSQILLYHASL